MKEKILIVEDQFVEADYLRMILTQAGYQVTGIAHSVVQAREMIKQERPEFILLDIFLKGKLTGIDLARELTDDNIAFVYLSANSNEEILNQAKATQPYGFLVKPFREKDLLVTLEIAQYRHEHSRESKSRREIELLRQLERVITDNTAWNQKVLEIGKILQLDIPFDFLSAGFDSPENIAFSGASFLRIGFDEYQAIGLHELLMITGIRMDELLAIYASTARNTIPAFFNNEAFEKITLMPSLPKLFGETFQMKSHLSLPVQLSNGETFTFCFYSRRADAYSTEHISLFHRLQQGLAKNIEERAGAYKVDNFTGPLQTKGSPVANDNRNDNVRTFEGIIGKSHLLLNIFDLIAQVAPSDTSVLILGESGTGKEKIADCIHNLSPRKNKPFVKVNCATLPANLIESELFGHEKGSFTGAIEKRIGKFEKADKGTIFLDEIGEMSADLQVKLLRVLQEKYIERIGSRDITKVDVRIIAATNRKLEKEVAEGRFRLDLYYRLNVFPLEIPALRERTEDIPALAKHFINHYNLKAGKKITSLSEKVLKNMMAYNWPGNIRELENLIERGVLLAKGTIIEEMSIPVAFKTGVDTNNTVTIMKTILENERDYIISVLAKCHGKIWGSGGAAEVLHLPPSTLKSKMKKLGISKEFIE